jgi:hypothetical protein
MTFDNARLILEVTEEFVLIFLEDPGAYGSDLGRLVAGGYLPNMVMREHDGVQAVIKKCKEARDV